MHPADLRPPLAGLLLLCLAPNLRAAPPAAPAVGTGSVPAANNPSNPLNPVNPAKPGATTTSADDTSVNASAPAAITASNPAAAPDPTVLANPANTERPVLRRGSDKTRPLSLAAFIQAVLRANLDLAAQRFNVPIARAQLAAARVSPNPQLALGTGRDLTHEQQPTTYNAGVTEQIELPGKRHFRVSAAQQNLLAASATLDDYLRTLRGTAASAYVDAVTGQLIVEQKQRAFESLNRLADANAVRLKAGDIGEVDADQARADALQARGDVFSSQSTSRANQYVLLQLLGTPGAPLPRTINRLDVPARRFDLNQLLAAALRDRPDLVAARNVLESARAGLRLARLNRLPDPTLGVTFQEAQTGRNPIDPTPNFNSVNLSVSVPLPVFNTLRGEARAAFLTFAQAEQTLRALELKAEVDVRGSLARYQTARTRLAEYEGGALDLTAKVLQARLTSYKEGASTLLDVLQAQKADTDVRLAYLDALGERAKAIIALEQAANTWDLTFSK